MFSTLIIRDCTLSAYHVECIPITVVLKATPYFPACFYDPKNDPPPVPDSWAARDVSAAQGTLKVSLLERISEDCMGVAYSAHVISATTSDSDITNSLPESVCLKFTKPLHSRSLAREARYYEQLACRMPGEQINTPEFLLLWRNLEHLCDPNAKDEKHISWSPVSSSDWLENDQPFPQEFLGYTSLLARFAVECLESLHSRSDDPSTCSSYLENAAASSGNFSFVMQPHEGVKEDIVAVMQDVGSTPRT